MHTFNRPSNRNRRRELRADMPKPELRLWYHLRCQSLGVKFRRQHGIGPYIVDFYCAALKLVVEIDGESHFHQAARVKDVERTIYLRALGLTVVRFRNDEVMEDLDGVLGRLVEVIDGLADPL